MRELACVAVAAAAALGVPARAAPLEAYGALPAIEDARLSPDGGDLAFVITEDGQRFLDVERLHPRETLLKLRSGSQKLRDLQWAGPRHLIVTSSTAQKIEDVIGPFAEWFTAIDIDLRRRVQRPLIWSGNSLNAVLGVPVVRFNKDRAFVFAPGLSFRGNLGWPSLMKVDLDAGVTVVQELGFQDTFRYAVDRGGAAIAEERYDRTTGLRSIVARTHDWKDIAQQDAGLLPPELLGLGRDGASILASLPEANDSVLREFDLKTGAWSTDLPVRNPDTLYWDSQTYRLIGAGALEGDRRAVTFFDPNDQRAWADVLAHYPGRDVALVSFSDDRRRFVVRVDSPATGPAYFLCDLLAGTSDQIGVEYPALTPADIGPVRTLSFKAADGLALSGYLTLPNGREPKNLPLVVFPHGGPAARDEPGFDWWAQAMASRGYAVLQVNFRGSKGLGWDLQTAGFGQWGRKMQTDLSDGVRYLAGQGLIDPRRVCIVGASYGGYAALAGATLDRGVYRCAVSVAGPSDLSLMVLGPHPGKSATIAGSGRIWLRYLGDPAHLQDISPAAQAAKADIPVLLIHGRDDTVVPYAFSQLMAEALKKAGKPVELVTLDGEDHWLSRGETRLQMLKAAVAFLEKHNPPR